MVDSGTLSMFSAPQGTGLQLGVHSGLGSMFADHIRRGPDGEVGFGKIATAVVPKTYEDILEERRAEEVKKRNRMVELAANFEAAELIIREFIKANDIKITHHGLKPVLGLWYKPYKLTYTPVVKLKHAEDKYVLAITSPEDDCVGFNHNSQYEHDNTTEGIVQYAKAYLARAQDL